MSTSAHWYDRQGQSAHVQPNRSKPGQTRPTTITDARKLGLLPSVTTVLGILDKPQLTDWKLKQVAAAAYKELVCIETNATLEPVEVWSARVIEKAFAQVEDAADLGTAIHAGLDAHWLRDPIDEAVRPYVDKATQVLAEAGITAIKSELRLVNEWAGYAGTTDLLVQDSNGHLGILDFKSRKTKPGQPCAPWDSEPMQVAAYLVAQCDKVPPNAWGANCYLSTTEPDRPAEIVRYDTERLIREWDAFSNALALWKHLKGYDPAAWKAAA